MLEDEVLAPLRADYPGIHCAFEPERETGRGYYVGACFHIYATNEAGAEFALVDGGFTTWTQQLLNNRKERLLISGLGTELFCSHFYAAGNATTGSRTLRVTLDPGKNASKG
jgi:hypothetical protein